jgi:hypothetical protein
VTSILVTAIRRWWLWGILLFAGGLVAYATIDTTVYTTTELVIIPSEVDATGWVGLESVLIQDLGEYALYQEFNTTNAAYPFVPMESTADEGMVNEETMMPSQPAEGEVLSDDFTDVPSQPNSSEERGAGSGEVENSDPSEAINNEEVSPAPEPAPSDQGSGAGDAVPEPVSFLIPTRGAEVLGAFPAATPFPWANDVSETPAAEEEPLPDQFEPASLPVEGTEVTTVGEGDETGGEPVAEAPLPLEEETALDEVVSPEANIQTETGPAPDLGDEVTLETGGAVQETTEGQSEPVQPILGEEVSVRAPCDEALGCRVYPLSFRNFMIPEMEPGTMLDNAQLRLSLAAKALSSSYDGPQRFAIEYRFGTSSPFLLASVIDVEDEISNGINGGYHLISFTTPPSLASLAQLEVRVVFEGNLEAMEAVYVDGVWLEVKAGQFFENPLASTTDQIYYARDLKLPTLHEFNAADVDFGVNELPSFTLSYSPQQNFFRRIFTAVFSENHYSVDRIRLTDSQGEVVDVPISVSYHDETTWTVEFQQQPQKLLAGKYTVEVVVNENDVLFTDTFQFYWGVIAVNTTRSRYFPNDPVTLELAALTDQGDTICDANLRLTIIDPENVVYEVPVNQTGACGPNNVTDRPDYTALFTDTDKVGVYQVALQHFNYAGEMVHRVDDSFEVTEYIPFDIERTAPTRIFPPAPYEVEIKVTAYRDFVGDVSERVPRGFVIEAGDEAVISTLPDYTLITWPGVTLAEGESVTFSYTFDAPDISPYVYLLGPLSMDGFEERRQWQIASDALNNIGWFTGTRTIAGTNLNAVLSPLQWSTSSIDNYYFAHATSSNSERVTLRQAGDYLVAVTLPQQRADVNNAFTRIGIEVRVNGVAVPQGLGRSGFIRNFSAHSESSSHATFLLHDVQPNDYVEVFVTDLTSLSVSDTVNVSGQAAMYIEYIPPSTSVFAATTTRSVASTSLNTATSALTWTETRQDTGFIHSNSVNPENIIISNPGTYRVHVSVPLQTFSGNTTAMNVLGRVLLDGVQVPGGIMSQGFTFGNAIAGSNDFFSSIHWSGIVVSTTTNQVLTITTEQEAAAGTVTVPAGFVGSIYIEPIPNDDTIVVSGTTVTGAAPNDWSPTAIQSVQWTNRLVHDAVTYTHSTTSSSSEITINEGGDYFLTYSDALSITAGDHTNVRVTFELNGVPVTGARVKSHFIRNLSANNNSSGAFVYLLRNVTAGSVLRVRVEEEATNQTVNDETPAYLTLTKKIALNERPPAPTMFNVPFDNIRFASTTPIFEFQTFDPDGTSDLQYEFAISTTSNFATATIRTSGIDAGFSNTASSSDLSPFTEANRIRFELQPADALADLTTYYWRVRARDVSGSNGYGDWSTTQSLTVNLAATVPNWYQTLSGQFSSNSLVGAISSGDDRVQVDSGINSEILIAYGDGTNTIPRYRLWQGTSWGTQLNAIPVGGTINWVRTAAGITRDEYILVTLDQSSSTFAQVYSGTSSSWGNQVLITNTVNNRTQRGIAVGYESLSGDAMVVSCSSGPAPVYRIWNGSTWSATSSISVSSLNNCSFLEIASDPASDEMILVVRDSGASVGNNYEALVWDGNAWIANRTLGSVQAGQLDRAGIGLAYENSGQQAIIAVTDGAFARFAYTTWDGTSFSTNTTQPLDDDFEFGRLVADTNSDDMALCYVDEDTHIGVVTWNGGGWQTFREIDTAGNTNTGRPIDCEFETLAGRTNNLLISYSDTLNVRYQVYSGSWPVTEQTVTGVEDSFWVQTERAGDGTVVMVNHDDFVVGDEIESTYFNGTNWSTKQSIVPDPSSIIGTPYETFAMSAKRFQFSQGVVTSPPVSFSFVPGRPTWGDLSFSTTEPFGTDVKVRLRFTSTTTCDAYIPNSALPGNITGFDVASSTLNISGLSTSTYSQICLEATITTLGSESASLDEWSLTWLREPKLIQNNYRWYANGSFYTPTDPWPVGVTDVLENTPLLDTQAVNINDVIRLRLSLQGSNVNLATSTERFKLQYAPGPVCTPLSAWSDVGGPASTSALWRGFENSIVGSDWYGADWKRRVRITVENTLVGTSSAITDFPVYVNLDDLPPSFFDNVQSDGDDIRITTSDGVTELPYELVAINTTNDTGELHFRAPSLSSTTDTVFYIYYGNSTASGYAANAPFGSRNVWTNGYVAVYHLRETGSTAVDVYRDSTANQYHAQGGAGVAANVPTATSSGFLGTGQSFDGAGDLITNNRTASTMGIASGTPKTISAWTFARTFNNGGVFRLGSISVNGQDFSFRTLGGVNQWRVQHWGPVDHDFTLAPSQNTWRLFSLAYDGTTSRLYGDGVLRSSRVTSLNTTNGTTFGIGTWNGTSLNGVLDEVRIANVNRSLAWHQTEFNNQSNPTGFYGVAAEELIGDGRVLPATVLSESDYAETYEEQNPTLLNRNLIVVGNDAEWDFALQNFGGAPNTEYCFRLVYVDGSVLDTYRRYPRLITNSPPPPPTLSAPFDNEQFSSSTPWFEFSTDDALSDDVSYQIQIDNNYDFGSVTIDRESNANFGQFTNLAAPSQRGLYTTGNTIQFIPNTTLSPGTYYWRVRARDDNGSGAYSDWSVPFSFTIASTSITTWFQTTGEQFATNNLLDAVVSTSSNDVGILTGFTSATVTSTAIDYDDRDTGNAWGQFSFTHNVTSGSIRYYIEYDTGGGIWAMIPNSALPGNESGFTSSPVSLAGLDPTDFNEIRITAVLVGTPTLPRLLDWRVEWGETIEVATMLQPFDNAKANSTLPELTFFTTDPQSDDLQYEVQISTTYDFLASSTFVSGVAAGFTNQTNVSDTSPFTSGHTIRYAVQSPLVNGTTYWWRVRARDPGGTNVWSRYSVPQSFTVDTAVPTATWFQTTGEQFATNELVNIETTSGNAQITSVISEVMVAYGEGTGQSPQYRLWNGAVWSEPESAETVNAQIRWTRLAAAPTRAEYVLGTLGTDLDINFQVYNGVTGSWGNKFEIFTESVEATKRRFDLTYETNSGDLIAVACADSDALFSVWNGTSWSATSTIDLTNSNPCEWVQLSSDPTSDEVIALFRHTNASTTDFEALVWNGSTWGNSFRAGDISNNAYEGMAVNYEDSGNQAVVTVSNGSANSFLWSAWNGSFWTTVTSTAITNDYWWASLKRDDGTDNMALCYVDASNNVGIRLWDGANWVAFLNRDVNNDIDGRGVDCEFETTPGRDGDLVIAYSDGILSRYQLFGYGSSSFTVEADISTMNDGYYMQTVRAGDGTIHVYTLDDASAPDRYDTSRWNGTVWSPLTNFSTNPSITAEPFNGSIVMAAQRFPNFTEGTMRSTPIRFSAGNSPRWERVRWNDTTPGASDVRYRVYYETATGTYALVPDSVLSGNAAGFTNSPINIASLDRTIYETLKLEAEFICSSGNCPTLNDWSVEWSQGITVSGVALDYDQLTAVATGTIAIAVNGVVQVGKTATLGSGTSTQQVVFDTAGSSTFTVPAGVATVTVKAWGAGGGGGGGGTSDAGGAGGGGGFVQGSISVIPTEELSIRTGGGGGGGGSGLAPGAGGGGGYSGVFRTATPLLVAGGGGGGGGGTGGVRFVAAGTACAVSGASCTPTIPAGTLTDDVYIAVLHSRINTAHTCTTNCAGWTEFSTQAGSPGEGRLSVWYYRQAGAPPANPTFAGPATDSYVGRIWAFRGVATAGDPFNVLGSNTAITPATTTFAGSNLTSTVADAMVVHVAASMDDNSWGPGSGSCSIPISVNTTFFTANTAGGDNSVALCYRENPVGAAGSLGIPINTQVANSPDVGRFFTFALRPNSVGIMPAGRGGAGGGTSAESGQSASTTSGGGGGTQLAGGAAGGGTATIGSSLAGGSGSGGTGGGAGGGGGLNGGGAGGNGNLSTLSAAGGGGGAGYFGGGGASSSPGVYQAGAGGGGGSSFIETTAQSTSSLQASGAVAANTSDPDYVSGVGAGGGSATSTAGTNGGDGRVVISWSVANTPGAWSIPNIAAFPGDVITVFMQGASGTAEAVAVTRYDGTGDISGLQLSARHLTIGSQDAPLITNAHLGLIDNSDTEDIFYTVTGANTLTLCDEGTCGDARLRILSGSTYQPGANATVINFQNNGTFSPATSTFRVSGLWQQMATFTPDVSTIIFTATSGSWTLENATSTYVFHNVTFGEAAGSALWTLTKPLDITGTLGVDFGTLGRGTTTINLEQNLRIGAAGAMTGIGTTTFDGSGSHTWSDATASSTDVGHVVVDGSAKTITLGGNVRAQSVTIGADDALNASGSGFNINVVSGWNNNNLFIPQSGTVTFVGTSTSGTINRGSSPFNNLAFTGAGSTWSFSTTTLALNGSLTIATGTVTLPTGTTTIGGSFVNSGGTFLHNNGEVRMTSNVGGRTITQRADVFTNAFYDLVFSGSGAWTFSEAGTTSRNLLITAGAVTFPTSTLTVVGDLVVSGSGSFAHNNGEVILVVVDTDSVVTNGSNFNNVRVFGTGAGWYNSAWNFRTAVTVQASQVATTSPITDFPVYVNLSHLGSSLFSNVRSDGGDIRVTLADGVTEIPAEVAQLSIASSTGELYFRAPSLSTTTNTTFYIYYGNAGATLPARDAAFGLENVWTNNYVAVYHLNEVGTTSTSSYLDSTRNRFHAQGGGGVVANIPGRIVSPLGFAANFDAANDVITVNRTASVLGIAGSVPKNITAWAFTTTWSGGGIWGIGSSVTDQDFSLRTNGATNSWRTQHWGNDNDFVFTSNSLWVHFSLDFDGANSRTYANAGLVASRIPQAINLTNTNPLTIGRWTTAHYGGRIDSLRVSSTTRSQAWLRTEFNNQASSTSFYATSTAEARFARSFNDTNATVLGNLILATGGSTIFPTGVLSVGGSFDNDASFSARNGTVRFNSTAGTETIAAGTTSPFATLEFNSATGDFTVTENATATVAINLINAAQFTLQSGRALTTLGSFTNTASGTVTTWTGSALILGGGSSTTLNAKTHGGDVYGTLVAASSTLVRMWNSSADAYSTVGTTSAIYSQDHAGIDGNLNIYGNYTRTSGTEHWSHATDFDGVALGTSSARGVNVRIASSSVVTIGTSTLSMIGSPTASTSIDAISGAYDLILTRATTSAQFFTLAGMNTSGLRLVASSTLQTFSDGSFTVVPGRSGITIDGPTVNRNATSQFFRINFATTTAGAATNVTLTSSSSNFVWFRQGGGNLYGEAFDSGDGNPGSIRFDDSSNVVAISGTVFADAGVTSLGAPVCNGITPNVRIVVIGGGYASSTPCNATTGAYSFPTVSFVGDPRVVVYLDLGSTTLRAATFTKTITANVTNMHLYANRLIVRHEDSAPLTIADLAQFDSDDESDLPYNATTTGSSSLAVLPNTELFVFAGRGFAPGGNVTLRGNANSNGFEGTLNLGTNATFTATGTELHTLAGRLVVGPGAIFTPASSTFVFNATTTGKSLTGSSTVNFHNLQFNGAGGSWNIGVPLQVLGDMLVATGTLTGTASITVPFGSISGNGTLSLGGGTVTLGRTSTLGGTTPWTFSSLTLGNGLVAGTTTRAASATTTILGTLTIATGHVLDADDSRWDLAGTSTVFVESGTFLEDTSTVRYSGAGANVTATNYFNLTLSAAVAAPTYTAQSAGFVVLNNLTVGGPTSTTFTLNTNDPMVEVRGNVVIAPNGSLQGSNSSVLTVLGNWDNDGVFVGNGGTVRFAGSASTTIAAGASSFSAVEINGTGTFSVIEAATSTGNWSLVNHGLFTVQSGLTLAVGGLFQNALGGASTTWTGSTLSLFGTGTFEINSSSTSDVYATLRAASSTQIRMWNSSASTYAIASSGSLYSMDHAGVDGDLYIFGQLSRTSGADFWSFATDFDGTPLASGRGVDVFFASGSRAVWTGGNLSVVGSTTASTTLQNQGSGVYGLQIAGTASTTWDRVTIRDINASGVLLSGTPTVVDFSRTDHLVRINGASAITVGGTVINQNPAKNFTNNVFEADTGATGAVNVTATGSATAAWRFTNHTGDIAGEAFDVDPDGDPGYVVWDDSAALITIAGNVYSDEGSTVSSVCDGTTPVVRLVVAGLTTYDATCAVGTGAFSITNVAYNSNDTLTLFLNGTTPKAATISVDPISSVSNMHLYERRVILRHEGVDPISIDDIAVYDSSEDSDIPFTAVSGAPDTLVIGSDRKLIIWNGKTFAPGGNVTLTGAGSGDAVDGTFEAQTGASFVAASGQTHAIGGSLLFGTGAVFTGAQSTVVFTSTTSARTIDVNAGSFGSTTFSGTGSWIIADPLLTLSGTFSQSAGAVTFPTGTTTIGRSFSVTGGTFTISGSPLLFTATTTGQVVRFGGTAVAALTFSGAGGGWTLTDTHATATQSVIINAGSVTLPSGSLSVGGNFDNRGGTIVHNTSDLIMRSGVAASLRASSSDLFAVRFASSGPYTLLDSSLALVEDFAIERGAVTIGTGTLSVGGSFTVASGTFTHASGTVLLNATSSGRIISPGASAFYNLQIGAPAGGYTMMSATTTNNFVIASANALTVSSGETVRVGGVFTNAVGGAATTWTGSTLILTSGTSYSMNSRTQAGDVYGTLQVGNNTDVRMWYSSAATTTVATSGSLYSQDHNNVNGHLSLWGDFVIATTSEHWSFATDFDGTSLTGSERKVSVFMAPGATTTLQSGSLALLGAVGQVTSVESQTAAGTYGLVVTGGTFTANHYALTDLTSAGLRLSGTPTITDLSNGFYELAINGGTLITLSSTTLNANPSKLFTNVGFSATGSVTGFNVSLIGDTDNAWRFPGSYGSLDGEAFDSDGIDACGSIRWDDSSCLLTEQTHIRWRLDNGGEGAPSSEWFNSSWDYRQRVRIVSDTPTSTATTAVKMTVSYDSDMQADFDDLRFTAADGITLLTHWVERVVPSATAVVWVRVPAVLPDTTTVFMYYGSSTASSISSSTGTMAVVDDFEDNNITEYSGETSLFQVDTTPAFGGSYALEPSNTLGRTSVDGLFRTDRTVSQGQVVRWMQYINVTAPEDDACTFFGVQTPGTSNQNYALCLQRFGVDRMVIARNVTDNDSSGTVLASTTVAFATGWYEVEVDWQTNNQIAATLYTDAGVVVATTTATDSTYTSGGFGFSYWINKGAWDSFSARARGAGRPVVYFGAEQTDSGAEWAAPLDAPGNAYQIGGVARLRIAVENSGLDITGQQFRLEYAAKGSAPTCESVVGTAYSVVPIQSSCGSSPVCMSTSSAVTDGAVTTDLLFGTNGQFTSGRIIENPSNQSAAFNLNQDTYTELEYVITPTVNASDSYCFRVTNAGTPLDFYAKVAELGLQFNPVVSQPTLNGGVTISLTPGTTTLVLATTTVSDFNGFADLVHATATFYRTSIGASCTPDNNNCYRMTTENGGCSFTNCAGASCELQCTAPFAFHTDATDFGTFAGQEWFTFVEVEDLGGAYGFSTSLGNEVGTLRAITVDSGINYGALEPASDTGNLNPTTTVTNLGNVAVDVEVEGTDLTDSFSSVIPSSQQKFSTSTFTYAGCVTCVQLSSSTPAAAGLNLFKPTAVTPPVAAPVYWGIAVPFGISSTPHSGTNIFTPVEP